MDLNLIDRLKKTHSFFKGDRPWLEKFLQDFEGDFSGLDCQAWQPKEAKEKSLLFGLFEFLERPGSLKIRVKKGEHLSVFYDHEEEYLFREFHVEAGGHLQIFGCKAGGSAWNETLVYLEGPGAEVETQMIFLGSGEDKQKWTCTHVHQAPETKSKMVLKGAVAGRSAANVYGNILMEKGVDGASAELHEHNLILNEGARVEAIPALEIAHHNLTAGHSASLERVNEEELFYLLSRGLSKEESLQLILEGFFWATLDASGDSKWAESRFQKILQLLHV